MTTADLLTSLRAEQHDFANARLNAVLRRELDRSRVVDRTRSIHVPAGRGWRAVSA